MTATIHIFPDHDQRDYERRLNAAEVEAGWFFDKATVRQKAEYNAAMASIRGLPSDAWNAARDLIKRQWHADTKEARELLERSVEQIMKCGEIDGETDDLWTDLIQRETVRDLIAAE